MKKTKEIVGLPIISISDGMEVGTVKGLVVNAGKGAIDYMIVDDSKQLLSTSVISTVNVLGMGEYAVTIENDSVINDISKIPEAVDLVQKNIQVKGTKVLTKKGRLIGEIGDIYVDEDSGTISALEFIADPSQKVIRLIPRESVITFGKNMLVVIEEVEGTLVDTVAQLSPKGNESENEKKNDVIHDNASANEIIKSAVSLSDNSQVEGETADSFEQRQKQYLRGRVATKTVTDNDGNVIINEGAVITDEVIEIAELYGKIIELVMNNRS